MHPQVAVQQHQQQQQEQPDQQQQQPYQQQQIYFHTMEHDTAVHLPSDFFEDQETRKSVAAAAAANDSIFNANPQNAKVATKSLSALKSRKEEIIDTLQDIVGEEETKKISDRTQERASSLQKNTCPIPHQPISANEAAAAAAAAHAAAAAAGGPNGQPPGG